MSNPLDGFRSAIASEIQRITGAGYGLIFDGLDRTATLDSGDLILAIPRLRLIGAAPKNVAEKVASEFNIDGTAPWYLKQPIAEGIYVKFFFEATELAHVVIPTILNREKSYGFNPLLGLRKQTDPSAGKQRVIVEFSSPNIAKKFHAGHLRSTIIGGFISNLYESSGYDVVRMNYLGDWGRQYGLLACGWKKYGDEHEFARDPIGHLFHVYVKINADFKPEDEEYKAASKRGDDTSVLELQGLLGEAKAYFKRMEDGDEDALQLWRRFRNLSIEKYKETYKRLNITFTDYSGESHVKQDVMNQVQSILDGRGITEPNQGAIVIDFKKHEAPKLHLAIVRNRNGTSNYLLRDIGAAIQREEEYQPDQLLYVVMSEQDMHLQRLFKSLHLMGDQYRTLAAKMKHITFGEVSGMSTRSGNVKFLDDIIDDVKGFMHDVMRRNKEKYDQIENPDAAAEILGISAIMIQDMAGKRINGYTFSLDRMTSFEGDTGPYLQYAHARLSSIFRRIDITADDMRNADFSSLAGSPHALNLLRIMIRFPDVVAHTLKTLEPTTVLGYLFKLAHSLSSSYDHLRVVDPPEGRSVAIDRAALYYAAHQVLHNGMVLLGLTPLER